VAPDLRGFGASDKHVVDPSKHYDMMAQARSVAALITELGLVLEIAPPVPGAGTRIFGEQPLREFWYQAFHRLALLEDLIDGTPDAVRAYLRYFWTHWSGPDFELPEADLEHLVCVYSPPRAFTASINGYRAGGGLGAKAKAEAVPAPGDRLGTPTIVLWPEFDPLFPREWSDRLDDFFSRVMLRFVDGVGHFVPLECPEVMAEEILATVASEG